MQHNDEQNMKSTFLISTDLDGTLIDHHDYSFSAAIPAIQRCQSLNIPIILNTSKTYAEAASLQKDLQITGPLIVENGSALFISGEAGSIETEEVFGSSREQVLNFIAAVRNQYSWHLEGFNDWSVADISKHTGLSLIDAENANTKQFSEPFIWHDSDEAFQDFSKLATDQGLQILKGGRFYHLQGTTDKAKPLNWLRKHYAEVFPSMNQAPRIIALGDNNNDVAMLNIADIAVCVRSPVADYPVLSNSGHVIKTTGLGPVGWNEAISQILDGTVNTD